jgi:putative ABC transport system ATP-binding protein
MPNVQVDKAVTRSDEHAASSAVRLEAVTKMYGAGSGARAALRDVSVRIPVGTFTAVMGPSGSGKSTFLQCAAGLDRPTSGAVFLGDEELAAMNETQLTELRRERAGFVFQAFNLVPSLTVKQNILLPLRLSRVRVDKDWLHDVVGRLGLSSYLRERPARLSGGQQQRVAIARALITHPRVVFADEPTGALDLLNAEEILRLLRQTVDALGQTVVMVTHDPVAASYADTVLFLVDGQAIDSMERPTAAEVADYVLGVEGSR